MLRKCKQTSRCLVDVQTIKAEEKKRADEIQIQMAKVEADKGLTLKEMELKAQAPSSTNAVVDPPPLNTDDKSLKLPTFIDVKV